MDPIRNPYAPGAGQRPPELAGRDRELQQFAVTLERVAAGRPERSMVLSGLRGVGKTVLLNALRGQAVQRAWGTGKIEARPDQSIRIPVAQAVTAAIREVSHRHRDPDRVDEVAGVVKSFALRTSVEDRKGLRWTPPVDVPAAKGRADSGDLELDLTELFADVAAVGGDLGVGVALFVDEMQDIASDELAAICGACHEISQQAAPLLLVGAGLPHLPVALAASKSYAERLFRYVVVDRLAPADCRRALTVPADSEGVDFEDDGARRAAAADRRLPVLRPGLRQGHLGRRDRLAHHPRRRAGRRARRRGRAGGGLLRGPLRAGHPGRARLHDGDGRPRRSSSGDGPVSTADLARHLGRKPQSLSPARDGLIKKGLVYSGERGRVAFTVPHFGQFLRGR